MDYKTLSQLTGRYFRGETTLAEERAMRAEFARRAEKGAGDALPADMAAAAAMLLAAESRSRDGAAIALRTPAAPRWRVAAAVAASVAIMAAAAVMLARPTVYGYVNGEPVTSLAEARGYSQEMFSDLLQQDEDAADALRGLLDVE